MKKQLVFAIFLLLILSACTATSAVTETSNNPKSSPMESFQTWQDAYSEFLIKNIPVSEVDFDALVDDSEEKTRFSTFLAGGYPVAPFFYLHDIDNDKIPELIYIDPANGYDADVYTYGNNQISKTGGIKFYPFGSLGVPLDRTEGLYSDVGYKGHYGAIYLYIISDGAITEWLALEYNNQPELSPEHPGESYAYDDFALIDCYEVTEDNISKVIYDLVLAESEVDSAVTPSTTNEPWMEAYTDVLHSAIPYYSTDLKDNIDISRMVETVTSDNSFTASVDVFTVIDLDSDGTLEVVLSILLNENNHVGYEILHYQDGAVYGYSIWTRVMVDLKADATFTQAGGAADFGFGTMHFTKETWSVDRFAECASYWDLDEDVQIVEYHVNNESATEAEFQAIEAQQDAKPDAVWYEFTDANIEAVLS